MAITQVTTETIDGVVIGLSDTVGALIQRGEFTLENLTPYMYCGNSTIGTTRYGSLSGNQSTYQGNAGSMPLNFPVVNTGGLGAVTVEFALNDNIALEHNSYGRNILLYGGLGNGQITIDDSMTNSDLRVVTSIDFTKIYYDVEMASATVRATRPQTSTKTIYQTGTQGFVKTATNNIETDIHVFDIFDDGNHWYCIIDNMFPASDTSERGWLMCPTQYIAGNFGETYTTLNDGYPSFDRSVKMWRWPANHAYEIYGGNNGNWDVQFQAFIDLGGDIVSYCNYTPNGYHADCTCFVCGLDNALKQVANAGLKFRYNNKWYKPLGQGGVIYGYTDDMTKTSEWDNITNVTGNTVPLTPPAPPAPDKQDNEIEMDLSHYSTLNGFIQYYLMSISTVDDLAAAMNRFDITLIGKDLLPNLISYKMFAIPSAKFSTGTTRTITIAGHEMKKVNDDPIQAPIVLDINPITLDTITIPHTYNDFRDYDPYTKIEMFVPFCGWFTLPPWCMGRAISGTMYVDLPNGTVKAVIKASQTVVAEIGGSCAVDVPFVAQSVGSKTAAVISNMANGLIATTDPTPQSFVSSSMGIATALNRNYTQCKGVMGDGSNVQGLNRVYIKVTRPSPTETLNGEISARYKHGRGLPCGKFLTLAKGDGFTQITDANITGTMTAREKQMIIDGFQHGLIL